MLERLTSQRDEKSDPLERMVQFDAIDLEILRALQIDGRATNVKIAAQASITPPPTLRRTKALEKSGIILGYRAVLDGRKLGYTVLAFIQVRLARQSVECVKPFETLVATLVNVRECYSLSGQHDFLLRCVFRDLSEANHFVAEILLNTQNVDAVTTSFAVRVAKHEPEVPLALVRPSLPSAVRSQKYTLAQKT